MNGKRDMRKKFVKSSRPTYKKRIRKAQQGMRFVNYNVVENPTIDYKDITNPTNPFSEYNFNTTYNTPQGLVVPTREDSKPDTIEETPVVANNPTVEPVVNKPVTSKATYTPKAYKGLAEFNKAYDEVAEFNKAYDEVEASNPEAKKYRQFLTKMAEQESGFNSAIQNRAGAPAYGYFQFMQDDKKYNNIRQYAGTDIETFRSNPKLQIEAAIKLAKSFENGFSKEDLELAKKNGYSTWGLLGGAWLAGNGGVRKFLQGKGNPSDRHWSKEGKGTDVAARIKAFNFKEGGIIKYQEPAHGIARRDATYVAPKTYAPRPYKTKEEEIIEQNRSSEMISIPAHSTISMVDGKLQVVDIPARQITNIGAGYLSGTDPIGEFVVGNAVAGKPLMWLGRGLEYGAARAGSQWARNRAVGKAISNSEIKTPTQSLPNNVGWGPRQTIKGAVHDKDNMDMLKLYHPDRWDAINEGAPKAGVWFQGKLGTPRDATNTSIANKVEKAANARNLFAKRPVRVEGDLELNKPLVTVGDVPNRAQIQKAADTMGGDGVIFNNVYDNGYGHNQVIFSYRTDLKNGKMFKKGVRPLERQNFMDTPEFMRGNFDVKVNMRNFVEYLLNPKTQQRVANIDAELSTKYGEAISEFIKKYKADELKITPRTKGELDVFGDAIRTSQTAPSESFLQSGSYDDIFFDILKRDPAHVPGHEAKHGIEIVNAALMKDNMTKEEYLKFMRSESPRLQALMKDNIVSEDEFVKRIMREHLDYKEASVRNRYRYLTSPTEFNSQLHPLIEFEQRAGKSGVPNFKSVDEIDRLINNNPYVGTGEKNGLRNLRLLFNYIIKDKNEFMRRFNKYGFGTAVGVPTATTINNYDNE